MNPKLTSALMYAQYHFKVFPLKVNSKSGQVLKSWKEEATTDQDTIMNWFLIPTTMSVLEPVMDC